MSRGVDPLRDHHRHIQRSGRPESHDVRNIDEAQHHVGSFRHDLPPQPCRAPCEPPWGNCFPRVIFGEKPGIYPLIEIKEALGSVQHSKTDMVPSPRHLIPQPRKPPLRATAAHSSDHQDYSHRATCPKNLTNFNLRANVTPHPAVISCLGAFDLRLGASPRPGRSRLTSDHLRLRQVRSLQPPI